MRTLARIREDLRNYLELAAVFRDIGEEKAALEYEEHARAMERELELRRMPCC